MKRLAVYVFWEKKGIVRDYVTTYLKGLSEVAEKIYVVVNGEIQPEGKQRLETQTGAIVLQRPNEGVDFWAYKTALDYEGDAIQAYQEVILCNCSCYGPIYPFSEMFNEMGKRDVDFWGITEWPINAGGYEGTWILSYFMVFRPSLFLTEEWKYYWENLCPVHSREECIDKHETKFTAYFAEKGFIYGVYCANLPGYIDMTIEAPDILIAEQNCPILKRKVFCTEYNRFLTIHRGDASKRALKYISENRLFDTDQIIDDMLETQHLALLHDCLQQKYIIPEYEISEESRSHENVVICVYIQHISELHNYLKYIRNLSEDYKKLIIAPQEYKEAILKKKEEYQITNCEFVEQIYTKSHIQDFIHRKNIIMNYEYVCVVHDEDSLHNPEGVLKEESTNFALDSLLASTAYVNNILELFQKEKRIGVLVPEIPLHGTNYRRYGMEWGFNYDGTYTLLRHNGIEVMMDQDIPPIAPFEGMFWFRRESLFKIFDMDIDEKLFISGNADGTMHHVLLRAIPYIAQSNGYMTGNIIPISLAENQLVGLNFMYRSANLALTKMHSSPIVVNVGLKEALKNFLKKHLPHKVFNGMKHLYYRMKGRNAE